MIVFVGWLWHGVSAILLCLLLPGGSKRLTKGCMISHGVSFSTERRKTALQIVPRSVLLVIPHCVLLLQDVARIFPQVDVLMRSALAVDFLLYVRLLASSHTGELSHHTCQQKKFND